MDLSFSFIVPVFNRPNEIKELLDSLLQQTYTKPFEVVIVEDGSTLSSGDVVSGYADRLTVSYYTKPNSGPGDSRNYGMRSAKGNYFIILDSDCILPPTYLEVAENSLEKSFAHCYGGPDAASESFSTVQKAINYAMTSFWTTGGIRGGKQSVNKFQPRSFNMGLSKAAFEQVGGFGNIHPGEDPDLTIRLWKQGYDTKLITEAYVYHKRRINWGKFYVQVYKFGMVRPILNKWHPHTAKITYWFPTLFSIGLLLATTASLLGILWPLTVYAVYFLLLFMDASVKVKNGKVALFALFATLIQFFGYGYGFLKSTLSILFSTSEPEDIFPKLFFKIHS